MLTATLGTPYVPDLDEAFLFWEDVNEPLYRLDRMLTHLRLSGSLRGVQGMIVGSCTCSDADPEGETAEAAWLASAAEIARRAAGPLGLGPAGGPRGAQLDACPWAARRASRATSRGSDLGD